MTLHSHSYLNHLNVYGVSNISGEYVSQPSGKHCCSITKFSASANGTTGGSRVNKAEKLGGVFIRCVLLLIKIAVLSGICTSVVTYTKTKYRQHIKTVPITTQCGILKKQNRTKKVV